jgi:hypothetical protein
MLLSYVSGAHLQLHLCIKWLASVVSRMALFWLVNGLYPAHRITRASSSCSWIILDDFHCIDMEVSQYFKWKRMVWTFTYTVSLQFLINSFLIYFWHKKAGLRTNMSIWVLCVLDLSGSVWVHTVKYSDIQVP